MTEKHHLMFERFLKISSGNEEYESTEEIINRNLYKSWNIDLDEFKRFLDDIP